jgi:hypothetical protein
MTPLLSTTSFPWLKVGSIADPIGFSLANNVMALRPTDMTSKILLPGDFNKPTTRKELIEKFMKEWLTKRQQESMGIWVRDLLQAFSTDLLLHAQQTGIQNMLMDNMGLMTTEGAKTVLRSRGEKHYPLAIITKPKKPVKVPVTLEEVGGDLESDAKVVPTNEVKTEPNCTEQ